MKNNNNKKGFTLIELLATIAIIALIFSIAVYFVGNIVKSAKNKTYEVTIANIESKVSSYTIEAKDKLFYVTGADGSYEYQCITVQNLIDYGYLDSNVTDSKVSEERNVATGDYVYIERDKSTKTITKSAYILEEDEALSNICDVALAATGDIGFASNPAMATWSKYKDITITYKLSNIPNVGAYNSYNYIYNYDGDYTETSNNGMTKVIRVTSNGTLSASIVAKSNGTSIAYGTLIVSKIDTVGPVISNKYSGESAIRRTVTIPIQITDDGSGVDHTSFTKDDLEITIGSVRVTTGITLTKIDDDGNYEIKIDDTTHDGKVVITIDKDKVLDNAGNGNDKTVIDPNVTFNNVYKITFVADTNTVLYTRYDSNKLYKDIGLTTSGSVPSISKEGYTFNGWYTAKDGGNKVLNSAGAFTGTAVAGYTGTNVWRPSNDITLYTKLTPKTYTINYYQGNAASTAGVTKLGSTSCTFGTACTLTTYADLGVEFPYSTKANSPSSVTSDHYWKFYGWSTNMTGKERTYTNSQSINPTTYNENLELYALGYRYIYFYSGIAPTTYQNREIQYWNPYSTDVAYRTSITIPAQVNISGWTFEGYKAGTNNATTGTTYAASKVGTSQILDIDTPKYMRALYSRTATLTYDGNGATSGSVPNQTKTQYYNSGTNGTNADISTPTFALATNAFTKSGYVFSGWAAGSTGGTQYSAGTSYSGFVPQVDNLSPTQTMYATWSSATFTINYYQGNATSTGGVTKIGTSTCTYGGSCTLKTYANLGATFPYSSASNTPLSGTPDHYWTFYGWSTSKTGTSKAYGDGATFNYTTEGNIDLYALGYKYIYFNSGVAPTSYDSRETQYWNPYSTGTTYLTSITIPSAKAISGWTFEGYKGGVSSATSGTTYASSQVGKTVTPSVGAPRVNRSLYSRTVTLNYDGNLATSGSTASTTTTQYYNSGYASSGSNNGATLGTPAFTLATCGFIRTNYTFNGWASGSPASTPVYSAGYTYKGFIPALNSTTVTQTMYATWGSTAYTVNYYLGNGKSSGGATKLGSSNCNYGTACKLKTFAEFNKAFPYSKADSTTSNGTDHYWTFYGWASSQSSTSRSYTDGQSINPSGSGTVVDIYALGSKSFSFYSGINPTSITATQTQYWNPYSTGDSYRTTITIPSATAITGWTFTGYKGGTSDATSGTTYGSAQIGKTVRPAVDAARSLRGLYSRALTFTYDANSGTGTTANSTATQYYNTGYASGGSNVGGKVSSQSIALRTCGFTRSGYSFSKWAEGSTSGTQYAAGYSYAFSPAVNVTTTTKKFYAIWVSSNATLTYNANGHGTAPAAVTMTYANATNAAAAITATGYTFSKWCSSSSGATPCYNAGATVKAANTTPSNKTLYAIWTEKTATLTYYANGHGTAPAAVTMKYSTATTAAAAITADGYAFIKWCTKADGTGTCYDAGATVKAASVEPSAKYLYAIWSGICSLKYYWNCPEAELCYPSGDTTIYSHDHGSKVSGTLAKVVTANVSYPAEKVYYVGTTQYDFSALVIKLKKYCTGLKSWYTRWYMDGEGSNQQKVYIQLSDLSGCASSDIDNDDGFELQKPRSDDTATYKSYYLAYVWKGCIKNPTGTCSCNAGVPTPSNDVVYSGSQTGASCYQCALSGNNVLGYAVWYQWGSASGSGVQCTRLSSNQSCLIYAIN